MLRATLRSFWNNPAFLALILLGLTTEARAERMSPYPNPALYARASYTLLDVMGDSGDFSKMPEVKGLLQILIDNASIPDNKGALIQELDYVNELGSQFKS